MSPQMRFLADCRSTLPPPMFTIVDTLLAAFKTNLISEVDTDQCVQHVILSFPNLLEQYNGIMRNSLCRQLHTDVQALSKRKRARKTDTELSVDTQGDDKQSEILHFLRECEENY